VVDGGFGKGTTQLGVTMSKKVKQVGCSMLKDLIESEKMITNDFDTIAELNSFVSKAQSYEADVGCHDDLVMSMLLIAWLSSQPHLKDMTDVELKKQTHKEKMKALEDDLLPFGFINDDQEDDTFVDDSGTLWSVENPS